MRALKRAKLRGLQRSVQLPVRVHKPQPTRPERADSWRDAWRGMPEYVNREDAPAAATWKFEVQEGDAATVDAFSGLLQQKLCNHRPGKPVRGIWYPARPVNYVFHLHYVSRCLLPPRYPVYVISKGRHESRLTSKALEAMQVPYHIVVEPQEYDAYSSVIDPGKILVLPFQDLGQGSIPARNWAWEHALQHGHARHWILDDNIWHFMRRNHSTKTRCDSGNMFRAAEDFVDRYSNVAMAGFNYQQFVFKRQEPPFRLNTRIYSCILIDNRVPHRWRGKYNEDTDLSLRVLKDGWCTVLFNAFLIRKAATMKMKGGNTDEVYARGEKRLEFAESLAKQHPDVARVVRKFGRWHHQVNYKAFKSNALHLSASAGARAATGKGVDDYGMELGQLCQANANGTRCAAAGKLQAPQ
jgi:hypothetical protein